MGRFCTILVCLVVAQAVHSSPVKPKVTNDCQQKFPLAGLSSRFSENIAHGVHSMTVAGLRLFNPRATVHNSVPTVNRNVTDPHKVLPYAPDPASTNDFVTFQMNAFDNIMSSVGKADDGLGPHWSPLERVAHFYHMWDLWERIRVTYQRHLAHGASSVDENTCSCLLDVANNGIQESVQWVAEHYKSGTPITLLDKPIPKLTDAATWGVWKSRLLHYYSPEALYDAAVYLFCATKRF